MVAQWPLCLQISAIFELRHFLVICQKIFGLKKERQVEAINKCQFIITLIQIIIEVDI